MKYNFRTDLAIETREAYQKAKQMDIPGVEVTTDEKDDVKITRVKVVNDEGANEIGKPIGNYITLEVPKIEEDDPDVNEKIYKIFNYRLEKYSRMIYNIYMIKLGTSKYKGLSNTIKRYKIRR